MQRHPEYSYRIKRIYKENEDKYLIYIGDANAGGWEEELLDTWSDNGSVGPVEFLFRIKDKTGWNLKEVGWSQYSFAEDDLKMVFQFDDLFGFVIVTDSERLGAVKDFLSDYVEK